MCQLLVSWICQLFLINSNMPTSIPLKLQVMTWNDQFQASDAMRPPLLLAPSEVRRVDPGVAPWPAAHSPG